MLVERSSMATIARQRSPYTYHIVLASYSRFHYSIVNSISSAKLSFCSFVYSVFLCDPLFNLSLKPMYTISRRTRLCCFVSHAAGNFSGYCSSVC